MLSIYYFLLLGLGEALFQTPSQPPSITVGYDSGYFTATVDLEYINRPPVKYTYDIRFSRWESSSSLYSPQEYGSRKPATGSWEQLWEKSPTLNPDAISGSYGAWPPPAVHWNLSIVSKNTVRYRGRIPLQKLLDSVLADLEVTATHFVYRGTLFVHYLQPVRESVYSVTSYSKPFILSLDRKTEGIEGIDVSHLVVSILSSDVLGLTGLRVRVETSTPAFGAVSYGRLRLFSVSGGVEHEENTPCITHPDSSEEGVLCRQVWTLTLDHAKEGYYNETYILNYGLETCLISVPEDCIHTDTSVKASLLVSGGSTTVTRVDTLAVERHNITYYYDSLFSQQRLDRGYLADETIRFRHLSQGEYPLELWNLWVCSHVKGGLPPSLGSRRGCSAPESIQGTVNIPEHTQWQLLREGEYTEAAEAFNFQLQGRDAASMNIGPLTNAGTIYLHLESRAVKVEPHALGKPGKYEMSAAVIDGIHTLTTVSPIWMWPVVGAAIASMSVGAYYIYCRGKKKSFLTGNVRV